MVIVLLWFLKSITDLVTDHFVLYQRTSSKFAHFIRSATVFVTNTRLRHRKLRSIDILNDTVSPLSLYLISTDLNLMKTQALMSVNENINLHYSQVISAGIIWFIKFNSVVHAQLFMTLLALFSCGKNSENRHNRYSWAFHCHNKQLLLLPASFSPRFWSITVVSTILIKILMYSSCQAPKH